MKKVRKKTRKKSPNFNMSIDGYIAWIQKIGIRGRERKIAVLEEFRSLLQELWHWGYDDELLCGIAEKRGGFIVGNDDTENMLLPYRFQTTAQLSQYQGYLCEEEKILLRTWVRFIQERDGI